MFLRRMTVLTLLTSLTLMTGMISLSFAAPPSAARPMSVGIEMPSHLPVTPAVENSLRELGIDFINYYVYTDGAPPSRPATEVNSGMLDLCKRAGLDHALATHHFDIPAEAVQQSVKAGDEATTAGKFRGVVMDEIEHIRLLYWGMYGGDKVVKLADPREFKDFNQAYDLTLAGYKAVKAKYGAMGADTVVATHIWPVMLSIAARAGLVPCPKICKELYSPVSLAQGIGAAKQYGTDLWVDNDLWLWASVPGHPAEELKSNLMLAYWLGADRFYIEGSGFNLLPPGLQGIPFSLMTQINNEHFNLTAHGEVLRWFCKEYMPAHPRPWTFRDIRPEIAMVRFEDTDHGQLYGGGADRLYGSPNLRSTADTRAWFGLWNILTHGYTGRDGLTFFKGTMANSGEEYIPRAPGFYHTYNSMPKFAARHNFFVPLNNTVVYDHLVGYELLKDVPCILLTGVQVSEPTMAAIRRCVSEGAVCIAWGPLAKKQGFDWNGGYQELAEGKGKFILTDDFGMQPVLGQLSKFIGSPYEIRYRFKDYTVHLKRVDENKVHVVVDGL